MWGLKINCKGSSNLYSSRISIEKMSCTTKLLIYLADSKCGRKEACMLYSGAQMS